MKPLPDGLFVPLKESVMSEEEDDLLRLVAALIIQIILTEDEHSNRVCQNQ
jgi:hypothetical protein